MHRSRADRHLPRGAYIRDASEIAKFGKRATIALGGLAMISDAVELVGDAIHEQAASADLLNLGEIGLLTVTGLAVFHTLHKRLGARADALQN